MKQHPENMFSEKNGASYCIKWCTAYDFGFLHAAMLQKMCPYLEIDSDKTRTKHLKI